MYLLEMLVDRMTELLKYRDFASDRMGFFPHSTSYFVLPHFNPLNSKTQ